MPTEKKHPCSQCQSKFSRAFDLKRHESTHHQPNLPSPVYKCLVCGFSFLSRTVLLNHIDLVHDMSDFIVTNQAWARRVVIYTLLVSFRGTASALFDSVHTRCETFIKSLVMEYDSLKISTIIIAEANNLDQGEVSTIDFAARSQRFTISRGNIHLLHRLLRHSFRQLEVRIEDFVTSGSGWVIEILRYLQFEVFRHRSIPMRITEEREPVDDPDLDNPSPGTSGSPLPKSRDRDLDQPAQMTIGAPNSSNIGRNRFLIHTHNIDSRCFLYAVAAHWLIKKLSRKALTNSDNYQKFISENMNTIGLTFPLAYNQVSQFIMQNKHLDLVINAVALNSENCLYPLQSWGSGSNEVNILFYETSEILFHASYIININKFLRKYYTGSKKTEYGKESTCPKCFHPFYGEKILKFHLEHCLQEKSFVPKKILPKTGENIMQFKNYERTVKNPFTIYLDFETLQKKTKDCLCKGCKKTVDYCFCQSTTIAEADLIPKCFSLIVININFKVIYSKTYIGDDAAEVAVKTLMKLKPKLAPALLTKLTMEITEEEELLHKNAKKCYLCNCIFDDYSNGKVRDHNHFTGKYAGAAHNLCNLRKRRSGHFIPVYSHNMTGFDSTFLVKALHKHVVGENIRCIGGEHF